MKHGSGPLSEVPVPGIGGGEEEGRVGDGLGVSQPPRAMSESINNTHTSSPVALSHEMAPDEV